MTDNEISFHFIKAPDCKDFAVDGAFGGLSAYGKIVVSLYSERPAIPKTVFHDISDDNMIGPEKTYKRESKNGFVRIVQCCAYFDLQSAISFHKWLGAQIDEAKKLGVRSDGK